MRYLISTNGSLFLEQERISLHPFILPKLPSVNDSNTRKNHFVEKLFVGDIKQSWSLKWARISIPHAWCYKCLTDTLKLRSQ